MASRKAALKDRTRPLLIALAMAMIASSGSAMAKQDSVKKCDRVEALSVSVIHRSEREVLQNPVSPGIELAEPSGPGSSEATSKKTMTIIALGPVLGSMDSAEIGTGLTCTAEGLRLTAVITRSADFQGGVHKNILWQPKISIAVAARNAHLVVETIWRMRLTNGTEVDRSQTPPYPEQRYPMTFTKTLTEKDR